MTHGLRTETGHHHFVHDRSDEGQPRPRDGSTQGNQQGDHRAEHNQRGAERGDGAALDGVVRLLAGQTHFKARGVRIFY